MNYMELDLIHPIKLYTSLAENVFFISDTHFGHNRDFIYEKRGYKSVIEHDTGIIDKWNKKVNINDTIIHCGDIMFGEGGLERLENYFNNLNFETLYLLPGNHHAGLKQFLTKYDDGHASYECGIGLWKDVIVIPNYSEFIIDKQPIVVCHYPISSWNGMSQGSWCICGHCHGSFIGSQLNNPDGKILDVGIEVVNEPQSFLEIKNIMDKKSIKIVDHHNKDTKNPF